MTFRDSEWRFPLKAIYVKTNPGDAGSGVISDITYENLRIYNALWWTVWIGPQQQNQPGRDSDPTGCNFLFPYVPVCPTQPRVSVRRITLRNITAVDTLPLFPSPGVVLCNHSNPFADFRFEGVLNTPYAGDPADLTAQWDMASWMGPTGDAGPLSLWGDWNRSKQWEEEGEREEREERGKRKGKGRFEYVTAYVHGQQQGQVQPAVCLQEDCYWPGAK